MDSRPSASPACTVRGIHSRASRSNAPCMRDGGKPASGPAMSKPTTPRSRWRTASSAISVPRSRWRMALTSWPTRMDPPASSTPRTASSMPDCTASTAWSSDSPRVRCCSGAQRISP